MSEVEGCSGRLGLALWSQNDLSSERATAAEEGGFARAGPVAWTKFAKLDRVFEVCFKFLSGLKWERNARKCVRERRGSDRDSEGESRRGAPGCDLFYLGSHALHGSCIRCLTMVRA